MKVLPSICDQCSAKRPSPLVPLKAAPGEADYVIALAGNPNTGKSTVFNALTGLRQHTGNWPGKTVARAEGSFRHANQSFCLVDLPGTYSLLATSCDEEIARDFLLFGRPDVTVIVVDATRLHRNLNLVLQVLEITDRAVVCVNLMDEAKRHRISIDDQQLSQQLGVPVVCTSARFDRGLDTLVEAIHGVANGSIPSNPVRMETWSQGLDLAIKQLTERLDVAYPHLPNGQWVALRLLDGDERVAQSVVSGELLDLARVERLEAEPQSKRPPIDSKANLAGNEILKLASELRWQVGPRFHEALAESVFSKAANLADQTVVHQDGEQGPSLDRTLDRILTNPWTGFPVMLLLLAGVLWLTIAGANYPSAVLSWLLLDRVHPLLHGGADAIGMPWWLSGVLLDGMYLATAWVVSVMLPPMAIFFPLFTLLEDFGYLPRVAFNLDGLFRRAGAHGKQALTMCMGLGCNAAGVVATRVIESPRERLVAIITNNFALCNGRWPTQILLATVFLGAMAPPYLSGMVSAFAVLFVALLGVVLTFLVSWGLSKTVLRGEPSTFHLELPPYRPPRLWQAIYTSLVDRTIFVLWRAIVFAVPAGAVIWLISNVSVGDSSLAEHLVNWMNPLGIFVGLNGVILLAYVVGIPANEIVIPTILMLTVLTTGVHDTGAGAGVLFELESHSATREILQAGGWTLLTAVNVMLFSLVHNPCSTTIYTIWKETRSVRWTLLASLLPLAMGFVLCFVLTQCWRLITGV
ncbi:ferrous iron transport protein B [Aeoliella mucimassa]|uniref:Ferrous iron transport protein B n=1 Tax=Aeoliella mucimassa TaxID=2527972 RepID=A0A518ATH5_9BACT|nr:ferrous iron transport protein B [Aeoliella mucimassa]QDU57997.1 Ferrous iron transport protein B [Aeoliella mucimassa]